VASALLGQRDVSPAGVLPGQAPFGLAVADEDGFYGWGLEPVEVRLAHELGELDAVAVDRRLGLEGVPGLGALRGFTLVGLLLDLALVARRVVTAR
jgi:hypothetical protein